jgi:hypothetical protein
MSAYSRYLLAVVLILWSVAFVIPLCDLFADEIRVVDGRGLVRAVKITRGAASIVVTLEPANGIAAKGECLATNVDGLAAEKRVAISAKSECAFSEVTGGSWQISVPQGYTWRVRLYE